MSVICRKAQSEDVDALHDLIQGYAAQGIMLPRSREALGRNIGHFVVAEDEGKLVGCGSLLKLGSDLVEIRSLGIADGYKGQGIGTKLVDALSFESPDCFELEEYVFRVTVRAGAASAEIERRRYDD